MFAPCVFFFCKHEECLNSDKDGKKAGKGIKPFSGD